MAAEAPRQRADLPQIPGYRIEGIVGKGATGIVYRARQLSVDRVVALKVLHRELVGATSAERRLQREARTTARLAHPNIISAIDMGEVGGVWWYAMELVDGESLADRLREGPIGEREALRLFIPLCEALEHAFERGVVHRDIKPANILIERGGRALLVDLGLAFADDDPLLTKSGATLGTPHYISPEQARDPSSADVQSDLWSFGATLYHAVCGRPPFAGESVAEILSAVLYERIRDPAQVRELSKGFVLVLRKCLTRDRRHRYQTPAELQADLERIRERRAPRVDRSALDPVARDGRARRHRLIAALVIVVAGAVSYGLLRERAPPEESKKSAPASDPITRLEVQAADPGVPPADVLAEVLKLQRLQTLSPAELARLEELRRSLYLRAESELWKFKRAGEQRIAALLAARDFDVAQGLFARELRDQRKRTIGAEDLPERMEGELSHWLATQEELVRSTREAAEEAFRTAFDRAYDERFLPEVDRLQTAGSWRDARERLTVERFLSEMQIDARGISPAIQESAQAGLRKRLDVRRESLDKAWSRLDFELREWVRERVGTLREELASRSTADYAMVLREDWTGELRRHGLSLEQMPLGLLHLAHEELEQGLRALAALDRELAERDARISYDLLEEESAELWRARRYAEIARRYAAARLDPWRSSVRDQLALREREALLLEELIERAANGVRERDGKQVTLRVGTIVLTGKVEAGSDPLAKGFRMTLAGGNTQAVALRPPDEPVVPEPLLCASEALEELAGLQTARSGAAGEPRDRLLRALLRSRERTASDPQGVLAVLNSGPMPPDEPLVKELEERARSALSEQRDASAEQRTRAEERFLLLRRELDSPLPREQKRRRVAELLQSSADLLGPDRVAELRGWQNELYTEPRSWSRESFERVYAPPRPVEIFGIDSSRVRLHFTISGAKSGAFEPGAWEADGRGWIAPRAARSDADMLERPGPTLALREPYRVQGEIDVRLRFEQPADTAADLLLISVAGFQVVLTGARDGRPARCLVDTQPAAAVITHARAGEGRGFAGLRAGQVFELHVAVHRSRGTARVELDGETTLADGQHRTPRDDPAAAALVVRSWEPVRLLEVVLEGTRR